MVVRGKNRDYSPDNRPAAKRPVICAKRRVEGARNAVDHVAATAMGGSGRFNTTQSAALIEQEAAEEALRRRGKRLLTAEMANGVDHVGRIRAGEAGRREYMNATRQQQKSAADGDVINSADGDAEHAPMSSATDLLGATQAPPLTSALRSPLLNTLAPPPRRKEASFRDIEYVPETGSGSATPSPITGLGMGAATPPRAASPRLDLRSPPPLTSLASPAPQPQPEGRSAARPRLARAHSSANYAATTSAQANVKAARAAEEAANEKAAVAYYGDIGVGIGLTSRKKTVAPPREAIVHPITGLLLPSARAASANPHFGRSRMSAETRAAIARGEFEVPLERRRSSIAVNRVGPDGVCLATEGRRSPIHSFRGAEASFGGSMSGSFGNSYGSNSYNNAGSPTSAAALRYISSPQRARGCIAAGVGQRHALRAAHPSESSHTRYLFGSAAIADRKVAPPPRCTAHAQDDTTFDKVPTAAQLARERRTAYAIEMVAPRHVPTNVSSLELRDEIPSHETLMAKLAERPATRRGLLAQQYNDTRGFFDPTAPLPNRHNNNNAAAGVAGGGFGGGFEPEPSAPSFGGGATPRRSASAGPVLRTAQRAASAGRAPSAEVRHHLMTALEQRASCYHGAAPPYNSGRRSVSPMAAGHGSAQFSKTDTARVLVPERQPSVEHFRPRIAPSPQRARQCQAARVMEHYDPSDLSAARGGGQRRAQSVDAARPQGIRSSFSAFVHPQMPYRPPVVSATQQSHLWGTLGGSTSGATVVSIAAERSSTPTGKRRVDSPARRSSICIV